jgi:alpha-1,2-mannosyltransferase
MLTPANRGLLLRERLFLYLFAGIVCGFGILVEVRSAGLSRRMGDLDCYLRGAWAARVGADMYGVVNENEWHYNYPPLYALLLIPLADPPPGHETAGYVPYPLSVAVFYVLNIFLLFWSAHLVASALEACAVGGLAEQPRFCRRWWALRLWPLLCCLPPAAQTAMRGQVNHVVLALLCLSLAGWLRQQRGRAGFFLGLAVCIKVIPIYLLVYPLWKRDGQALRGCGLGLFLGLLAIPLAVLGPARTVDQYERYAQVFFGPLLGVNEDHSRQDELLGVNATDSVGVRNALFNWIFFERTQRPDSFPAPINWGYRVLGGLMTLLVLWPGTRGPRRGVWFDATQFSALILLMAILSPICHLHYLVFCLPLVLCLLARAWEQVPTLLLPPALVVVLATFTVTNIVPSLPGLDRLKDLCVNLFGTLPIWLVGVTLLWHWPGRAAPAVSPALRQAA